MLTYRQGDDARRGGLDLTISLTADQAAALGVDAAELAEALDTMLVGLAALRTGRDPAVPADGGHSLKDQPVTAGKAWDEWLVRDAHHLRERLTGVRAAAIRAHAEHGGSYGVLAAAMGARSRATAQRRRDAVTKAPPSDAERWATTPAATVTGNVAGDGDVIGVQVGQHITSTNTRTGGAEVGHQADTVTGDLHL